MSHSVHSVANTQQAQFDRPGDTAEVRAMVDQLYPSLTFLMRHEANRRRFLQLMGASLSLAGLSGCRWPKEEILPYADQPDNRTPGVAVQYATTIDIAGAATGLLVTSYDGRPIKIEGNPDHPNSRGKTNAWQQASLLDLYDPDRSSLPHERSGPSLAPRNWEQCAKFVDEHFSLVRKAKGDGLVVIVGASASPSRAEWLAQLQSQLPKSRIFEYETISHDNQREGARIAYGRPLQAVLDLSKAKRIVTLDADLLMHHPQSLTIAAEFADGRRVEHGTLSRLVAFESNFTATGSMADDRYPLPSSQIGLIALSLLREVQQLAGESSAALANLPSLGALESVVQDLAADLWQHRGQSLVVAGDQQLAEVHAAVQQLSTLLESTGATLQLCDVADAQRPTHAAALAQWKQLLDEGKVESLLIMDSNPVATVAEAWNLGEAIARVPNSIHLGLYRDETAQCCQWHLPQAHYLESWNDARDPQGYYSLVQPLIDPFYDGKTAAEILSWLVTGQTTSAYELTKRSFSREWATIDGNQSQPDQATIEAAWKQTLHDGVLAHSKRPVVKPPVLELTGEVVDRLVQTAVGRVEGAFEVNFVRDASLLDGRWANNGWLQELPDPITKLTWDNAALLSKVDAARLGVKTPGDVLRIEANGATLEIPAFPLAGHARGAITLALGYGRSAAAGVVANGVGTDVRSLMPQQGSRIHGARITATGQHLRLALSQDNPAIQSKIGQAEKLRRVREELIKTATVEQYQANPVFAKTHVHHAPLWQEWSYEAGHKWGVSVDLSACIGCGGCVVACQAENNVAVVGKDEVAVGRIMHWLRIDRYVDEGPAVDQPGELATNENDWTSNALFDSSVRLHHQPMTCQQCESAPCEQVCPVAATVHDTEGLSVMVYSRCVGTRYCNNNCPFRVRRFNWFWNHHGPSHPRSREPLTPMEQMAHNPRVTVRSRGVMEKCSFCSQRINVAKIQAKNSGRDRLTDGEVTPACAQACPTQAIVFGDLNDPSSKVRKCHEDPRAYELLPELNLKSRLMYLAKLTNPSHRQANASEPQPGSSHVPNEEVHTTKQANSLVDKQIAQFEQNESSSHD